MSEEQQPHPPLIIQGNPEPPGCGLPVNGGGVAVLIPILRVGKLSSGLGGLLC